MLRVDLPMQREMGSRIAAVALAALALAAVAAAPAGAARGMEIGLQDDPHFLDENASVRGAAFAHARSLRASSLRANIAWASVVSSPAAKTAPAVVTFDFSRFDRLIDEAAANGIRVQLTLTGDAPAWATRNRKISDDHPDPQRYAEFAAAAASHFNGRVRALSIWNEPNWHGLLKPERLCRKVSKKVKGKPVRRRVRVCVKTSARVYRELYRAAYAAIKRVAPGMPVWIGETNPYVNKHKRSTAPLAWVRQVVCADPVIKRCNGGALRADGYAHHPYSFDRRPGAARPGADNVTLATLGRLSKLLRKLRGRLRVAGGSLYLTEFAYYSAGPRSTPARTRAAWTREAFELALRTPKVRQLLYYQLVDPAKTFSWRTGLITTRGSRYPAYNALRGFANARRTRLTLPRPPFALPSAPAAVPVALG
jgi:hypothetical protein